MLEKWVSYIKQSGNEKSIKDFFKILEQFNFVVAGGWGVSLYAKDRTPTVGDLDILLDLKDWEDFRSLLEINGFKVRGIGGYGLTTAKVLRDSMSFDILLTVHPWEEEALNYAIKLYWDGLNINIIIPEYIIVMKLYAGRDKDLKDITLITQNCSLNLEKLKKVISMHLGADFWQDFKQLALIGEMLKNGSFKKQ